MALAHVGLCVASLFTVRPWGGGSSRASGLITSVCSEIKSHREWCNVLRGCLLHALRDEAVLFRKTLLKINREN